MRLDSPFLEHAQVEDDDCWMRPIINYLTKGIQLEDHVEARKLRMKAVRYAIFNDTLYRSSFSRPYLRCLNPRQSEWVIRELHEGMFGNHSGGRSLAHRALTQGYFWPYMSRDAKQYARRCDKCQKYSPVVRQPTEELNPIVGPWLIRKKGHEYCRPAVEGFRE